MTTSNDLGPAGSARKEGARKAAFLDLVCCCWRAVPKIINLLFKQKLWLRIYNSEQLKSIWGF